jgi:hypothetical protein
MWRAVSHNDVRNRILYYYVRRLRSNGPNGAGSKQHVDTTSGATGT